LSVGRKQIDQTYEAGRNARNNVTVCQAVDGDMVIQGDNKFDLLVFGMLVFYVTCKKTERKIHCLLCVTEVLTTETQRMNTAHFVVVVNTNFSSPDFKSRGTTTKTLHITAPFLK